MKDATLTLTQEWDKTFPRSEKTDHRPRDTSFLHCARAPENRTASRTVKPNAINTTLSRQKKTVMTARCLFMQSPFKPDQMDSQCHQYSLYSTPFPASFRN